MIYKTSVQRFIAVSLIAPLMFLQILSDTAIAAPTRPRRSTPPQSAASEARKALLELAQTVRRLKVSQDGRTIDAAIKSVDASWEKFYRLLRLANEQIGERTAHITRSSAATTARIDAIGRRSARVSGEVQREYEAFSSRARQGPESARSAAETFEGALSGILDLSSPGSPHNPIPHRLGTSRGFDAARLPSQSAARVRAADVPPATAELSSTDDATITPEITALANQLKGDPVQIYSYVRNQILFDPYYGSRKGSLLTLWERSGNDLDTASLLIALLRASNIPSRYVQGTVSVDAARLENWLGNASDLNAAQAILKSAGTPIQIGQDGLPAIQHTWVEMFDATRSSWIALDASFKQLRYSRPIDISAAASFDPNAYINQVRSSGLVGLNDNLQSITGVPRLPSSSAPNDDRQDVDITQAAITNAAANLKGTITATSTNDAIFGGTFIVQQQITALPLVLPFSMVGSAPIMRFDEVPDGLRDKITIAISSKDDSSAGFSYQASYPSLANKRIVVSYEPATDFDAQIIQENGGTQLTVDPLFVSLVPVLRVNGTEAARGGAVDMGSPETRTLTITDALGNIDAASNTVFAGGMFAVGLGYGRASGAAIAATAARLQAARSSVPTTSAGIPDVKDSSNISEPIIGETLHLMMQAWFNQADVYHELVARSRGVRWFRGPSAGVAGQEIVFDFFFGIPWGTKGGGFFFDIEHNVVHAVSLSGAQSDTTAFMETTGMFGSALEHATIELFGHRSVSTIRLLSLALQQGRTIYRIDNTNRDTILPKLNFYGAPINQITAALDQGEIVTVPGSEVQVGDWSGLGYIIVDPKTGGAGYYISGGLQSGETPISGGSVVAALDNVAAFSLAIANILLNEYGFLATASALLLAPEITALGVGATLLTFAGLAMSISSLNALSTGSLSPSKYIADIGSALLVGGVLTAIGLGIVGAIGSTLETSAPQLATYVAELDAETGGAAMRLVEDGFAPGEIARMNLLGLESTDDLKAMASFTEQFGIDDARALVNNQNFAPGQDFSAGEVATIALEAPNRPGLADTVASAVKQNNDGFVYELQQAAKSGDSVELYNPSTDVTYTPVTKVDSNGVPLTPDPGSQTITQQLTGDFRVSGNTWIDTKYGAVQGDQQTLRIANQILKAESAIKSQGISFTFHSSEPLPNSLLFWAYQAAPDVNFTWDISGLF